MLLLMPRGVGVQEKEHPVGAVCAALWVLGGGFATVREGARVLAEVAIFDLNRCASFLNRDRGSSVVQTPTQPASGVVVTLRVPEKAYPDSKLEE